jgi:hypothetical protein
MTKKLDALLNDGEPRPAIGWKTCGAAEYRVIGNQEWLATPDVVVALTALQ